MAKIIVHDSKKKVVVKLDICAGFGWILLLLGLVLAGAGLVWILFPSIPWLGRLPGDIRSPRPKSAAAAEVNHLSISNAVLPQGPQQARSRVSGKVSEKKPAAGAT